MALIKCKECGEDVSSKAKACPKCGAKVPKKTSLFTWLLLGFIAFVIYAANQSPSSISGSSVTTEPAALATSEPINNFTIPIPSWSTSTTKNEMTGKFSSYAHSPEAYPNKRMAFPYSDVSSWMGVGCDSDSVWVYFGFNTAPNLTNDETKDGYNLIRTRIKWNEQVENVILTQEWGEKFIQFRDGESEISKISAARTALLELQWHGEQPAYFEYSLNGSSKAIAEIKAKCASGK